VDAGDLQDLITLLRFPSVSAQPEHAQSLRDTAQWLLERLNRAGLHARLLETGGPPVVYGEWLGAPGHPTVLIYGHYDVQPVPPSQRWSSAPFEPELRGGRIYARGASDMKASLLSTIVAVETLLRHEELALNIKVLIEGEEEIFSPNLAALLEVEKKRFACDLVVTGDAMQPSEHQGAVEVSSRGICGLELSLFGPRTDWHSGSHGGAVQNPLHALARLAASFHDASGRVAVKGFYEAVADRSDAQDVTPWNEAAELALLGLDTFVGEADHTPFERATVRPTLELNGLWGGYQGEGAMTIIPSSAHLKLTCRLVPHQDPEHVLSRLEQHIFAHTPPGVRCEIRRSGAKARAYALSPRHRGVLAAREVLTNLYGSPAHLTRTGGTLPVQSLMLEQLGVDTLSFGFSLPDEPAHGSDEFFRLSSFDLSVKAYCTLLSKLAEVPPSALKQPI
jgi:acetylornithine deacetylase/succinyl-diaminopimelate desuccinylase-like protein